MQPSPEPLTSIGPSHAAELLRCGYRVAWERDADVERRTPHVKAILGTIGHRLCERSATGRLGDLDDGWPERFDTAWKEAAEASAARHPDLGPPSSWAGHNLQKALWRNKAREAAGRMTRNGSGVRRGEGQPAAGVELPLTGAGGRLAGIADVVIVRDDGEVEIRDLKSGRTLGDEGEVAEPYRVQLLLYGLMYEDTFGRWPGKLVIDPLLRDPVGVIADRTVALRYQHDVLQAMDEFDRALAGGHPDRLARPSRDACCFCPHVSVCQPFWSAADVTWAGSPRAIRCRVVSVAPGSAVLSVNAGTIDYGEWTIGGIGGIDVQEGDSVQVVGFERRGERRLALGDEAVWTRLSRGG